jgi:hypothetical protein
LRFGRDLDAGEADRVEFKEENSQPLSGPAALV